jgi:hypothetical protein
MLRALLLIVALLIIAAIVVMATGLVDFRQIQGGQAPKVEMKVNKIDVGTTATTVKVPTVEMKDKQVDVPTVRVDRGEAATNTQ